VGRPAVHPAIARQSRIVPQSPLQKRPRLDPNVPIEDTIGAIADLVEKG
jgi:hypothetical protein